MRNASLDGILAAVIDADADDDRHESDKELIPVAEL